MLIIYTSSHDNIIDEIAFFWKTYKNIYIPMYMNTYIYCTFIYVPAQIHILYKYTLPSAYTYN